MRRLLPLVAAIAILIVAPTAVRATHWLSTRMGLTDDRTRVVLEFDAPVEVPRLHYEADSAVCFRLPGVTAPVGAPPAGGLVSRVEHSADRSGFLLVCVHLSSPATARALFVPRDGEIPDRLVLDLTGDDAARLAPGRIPVAAPIRRTVVIDAGHGGGDPGAIGGKLEEKEVALDVAKRLFALLETEPSIRPVLTRDSDVRIPLRDRMRRAENENGDLFVSIHLNASRNTKASGAEVFFLSIGAATDEAAKETARLENEADPDFVFEEDAELEGIPFSVDLRQSDTLRRSSHAAELLLGVLAERKLAEARGVKQAGFAVLKSFQVPSVLVEIGFISSPRDRKQLEHPAHRSAIAEALAAGIRTWIHEYAAHRASPRP